MCCVNSITGILLYMILLFPLFSAVFRFIHLDFEFLKGNAPFSREGKKNGLLVEQ